jgi:CRP-like cAMP-binding protein
MSELAHLRDRQGTWDASLWPARPSQSISQHEEQEHARGAVIYSCGEPADHLWRVERGVVRSVTMTTDGLRFVRDFHFPGDVFGFEANHAYSGWAEAVCDCRTARMRRSELAAAAGDDPSIAGELLSWMARHCERAMAHSALLARAGAEERIVHFLLDLAQRSAPERRVALPMTRSDIGDYLGLASETVSRAISRLRHRGLIATDRGAIVLLKVRPAQIVATHADDLVGTEPRYPA